MKYSDEVLNRVRNVERAGSLEGDGVGTGEVGTLDEGTVVRIQVKREGDRIAAARFKVFLAGACAFAFCTTPVRGRSCPLCQTLSTALG